MFCNLLLLFRFLMVLQPMKRASMTTMVVRMAMAMMAPCEIVALEGLLLFVPADAEIESDELELGFVWDDAPPVGVPEPLPVFWLTPVVLVPEAIVLTVAALVA